MQRTPPPPGSERTAQTSGKVVSWAGLYDALAWLLSSGKGAAFREKTLALARLQPGDRVLDVGCGTGDLGVAAAALVGPTGLICGIDAAPERIAAARKKAARVGAEVTFEVGLVEDLAFPDHRFDVVMTSLMMHHLAGPLQRGGLAELFRVLEPRGRLLIVDLEASRPSGLRGLSDLGMILHGGHARIGDGVRELIPLVEEAGFTNVQTAVLDRHFACVTGRKGGGGRATRRAPGASGP